MNEYETFPQGFVRMSKTADALRKQYARQGLDTAIVKMEAEIKNSAISPEVPLRAASWTTGARPAVSGWALSPVQLRSAIRRVFTNLSAQVRAALPAGFDTAAVVTRIKTIRRQVLDSGRRRVGFSGIPAVQGPGGVQRWVGLA